MKFTEIQIDGAVALVTGGARYRAVYRTAAGA